METLRFLMVTTFYPPHHLGGDAVHVRYLAEALAKRGHEVHVEYAPAAYRLKRGSVVPESIPDDSEVQVHAIPSPWGRMQPATAYALGRSRSVTRYHSELISDIRPDVVHFHNISLLGLGIVRRFRSERSLYTAHDYWVRCPRGDLFKYGRYPCDDATCLRCSIISLRPPQLWRDLSRQKARGFFDFAIAPSTFAMRAIQGALECPIVHIPNFAPDRNPDAATWEPGNYYLYVGVHEPRKGVRELAEAAVSRPDALSVVFVGLGEDVQRLKALQRRSLANIEIRGWVGAGELGRLYRHARGLIVPSLWHENSPLVAIEALSWGAPLLVSRRGGLEELLRNGQAGTSFEPRARDILSAIDRFEEADSPAKMREQARLAYEAHYHPDRYLEQYMEVVRDGDESIAKIDDGTLGANSLDFAARH